MADDKGTAGLPDRDCIDLGEDPEVQRGSRQLRVTPEKLRAVGHLGAR